jgi:GDP-L-fucose synthase
MRIFIAGQEGMVGSAIYKLLKQKKYFIIDCKRKNLDLIDQSKTRLWLKKNRPDVVINAAGKVGGILDNSLHQADYIYRNTIIGFNLIRCCLESNKVKKFINLGSACIYPKTTKQPIKEEYLLSSYLEETNEGYAIAKIATLKYCEYIKKFYKKDFISLQPANLYGVGDNFDLKSSHVIPALVRKFHNAKIENKDSVEVWGSGLAKREFLHVDDLASAVLFCLKKKILYSYLNVGGADYLSIKKLAEIIKNVTKFKGKIFFNKQYPDGVKARRLDVARMQNMGWKHTISLKKGLLDYYDYFKTLNIN